ncbi:MAG: four helix bundle protein [Opitutales bacterium]
MPDYDLKDRTLAFAVRIVRLSSALPEDREAEVIGKQVLRSGTSIGANYAEADSARSKAEFQAKLGIALMEAGETIYWLELLVRSGLIASDKIEELRNEAKQLKVILGSIYSKRKGK